MALRHRDRNIMSRLGYRESVKLLSLIYTTFSLGPALLKMGTRAVTFGAARLIFCRVNANFLARGPKKSDGPKKWPACPREKRFCGAFSHCWQPRKLNEAYANHRIPNKKGRRTASPDRRLSIIKYPCIFAVLLRAARGKKDGMPITEPCSLERT